MNTPSLNKLCKCQCNDIVNSWEEYLYMDFDDFGNAVWHDKDGQVFPAIVHSWEYATLEVRAAGNTKELA